MNEVVKVNSEVGRIAIFLPSLRGGGAERVMVTLAGNMAKKGHAVDLVVANAEGPYLKEVPASVRVLDLKAKRVLFSLKSLCRYLRSERPIAILSTMGHANMIALLAKRLSGVNVRSIVREANILQPAVKGGFSGKTRILLTLLPHMYQWADGVVAVSHGVAEDLACYAGDASHRVTVIYNPVIDETLFEKASQPVCHPWFSQGCPPVVLAVGRLARQKDFPTLIKAFSTVRNQECRLLILGEGQERASLENLVNSLGLKGRVDLPGFVDNPFQYMARSAVYVLSSRWEGLPNTLIQALAIGTPVIATDCHSGPREILQNGSMGKLVAVGDIEGMSVAIEESLKRPPNKTCRDTLNALYSVSAVTDAYLELLLRRKYA